MQIYLAKPGGPIEGPYSVEHINRDLVARKYRDDAYWAWHEGLTTWVPLYSIGGISGAADTTFFFAKPVAKGTPAPSKPPEAPSADTTIFLSKPPFFGDLYAEDSDGTPPIKQPGAEASPMTKPEPEKTQPSKKPQGSAVPTFTSLRVAPEQPSAGSSSTSAAVPAAVATVSEQQKPQSCATTKPNNDFALTGQTQAPAKVPMKNPSSEANAEPKPVGIPQNLKSQASPQPLLSPISNKIPSSELKSESKDGMLKDQKRVTSNAGLGTKVTPEPKGVCMPNDEKSQAPSQPVISKEIPLNEEGVGLKPIAVPSEQKAQALFRPSMSAVPLSQCSCEVAPRKPQVPVQVWVSKTHNLVGAEPRKTQSQLARQRPPGASLVKKTSSRKPKSQVEAPQTKPRKPCLGTRKRAGTRHSGVLVGNRQS